MTITKLQPSFLQYVDTVSQKLTTYAERLEQTKRSSEKDSAFSEFKFLSEQQGVFNQYFNSQLVILKHHVATIPRQEQIQEGAFLRQACRPLIAQSPFVNRTNTKPRGYQGDSELMAMIYDNKWQGKTVFGQLLHKYGVSSPSAEAVRNRRPLITNELRNLVHSGKAKETFNVLSVACGPACEIADIFQEPTDFFRFKITLLDQDQEALDQAKSNLSQVEKKVGGSAQVTFVKKSIGMLLRPGAADFLGQFNFIYSMGLYDYLDKKTAKTLTTSLISLLQEGGTILLGNYAKANQVDALAMDYWLDWPLVYRTESDFRDLVQPGLVKNLTVGTEPSGTQMFLRATQVAPKKLNYGCKRESKI